MVSKLAIFLICLTMATFGVVAAEESVAPTVPPSTQINLVKAKKTKAKAVAPLCPRGGQRKDDPTCFDFNDLPMRTKINDRGGHAGNNSMAPTLFLKGPGQAPIDDPNVKPPRGGSVGLRFRF
jgi:hypothetical protein